ncbi:MAG TPA: hypothetical protein VHZ03_11245 [Trebonia sp.]|nr:hypothetical protein [Trebonia sp.]
MIGSHEDRVISVPGREQGKKVSAGSRRLDLLEGMVDGAWDY